MSDLLFWSLVGFATIVSLVLIIVVLISVNERQLYRRAPAQRKSDREVIARYRALRSDTERMAGMQ
ncbi:hypothetical protein [Rhizobium herbae]